MSDGRGGYCAKCGKPLASPPPLPATHLSAPPAAATTAPRHPGRGLAGAVAALFAPLLLAGVGGVVYWGYWQHGFTDVVSLLRPAVAPASPDLRPEHLQQYDRSDDTAATPAGPVAGAAFQRVWVEGDTLDADGYLGLRIHARITADGGSSPFDGVRTGLIFSAHFRYSDGTPVRTDEPAYRDPDLCAATSARFTPGIGVTDVTAFMPRGAMLLAPGEHHLQVLPALLDSQGRPVTTAPPVAITARRDPSFITRVRAERTGEIRPRIVLKISFTVSAPFRGSSGRIVALFDDASGSSLPGRYPYTNAAHAMTASRDFASPAAGRRYDDISVAIPADLLPAGAAARVFVEDPSVGKAVTAAVRCPIP